MVEVCWLHDTCLIYCSINNRIIKAQCFPLYAVIQAVGNRTIDLLSLDVEGAEYEVKPTLILVVKASCRTR